MGYTLFNVRYRQRKKEAVFLLFVYRGEAVPVKQGIGRSFFRVWLSPTVGSSLKQIFDLSPISVASERLVHYNQQDNVLTPEHIPPRVVPDTSALI